MMVAQKRDGENLGQALALLSVTFQGLEDPRKAHMFLEF